jgi:PAS domain S-box-containing protein
MKILVVDDHSANRRLLRSHLEEAGISVVEAADGDEAVALMHDLSPDAIVSEILMPNMDGFQLCYQIRKQNGLKNLPFIICTANADFGNYLQIAREVGVNRILTRPIIPEILVSTIQDLAKSSHAEDANFDGDQHADHLESTRERLLAIHHELLKQTKELKRSKERYRLLFDNNPYPIWVFDPETLTFLTINDAAIREYGYAREEFLAMNVTDILPAQDRARFIEHLKKSPEQRAREKVWRHRKKNATVIFAEINAHSIHYDGRNAALVLVHDVTHSRLAEEALRRSEERFQLVARATNDAIWDWNLPKNEVWWNEGFTTLFGYNRNEIEPGAESKYNRIHPEDKDHVLSNIHSVIHGSEQYWSSEYRFRRADGTYAHIFDRGFVMRDDSEKPLRMVGSMVDVSQRLSVEEDLTRKEEDLRISEEKYRALFEESKDVVFISSTDGRFLEINPAGVELFGYSSKHELLNINIDQALFVDNKSRKLYHKVMRRQGYVKDFELDLKRKDGGKITVLETATAVRDGEGNIIAHRGFMRDVTQLKQLQQQILQWQKIETIGRLAGGVAHDFNNILMAILGYCELMQLKIRSEDALQTDLKEIQKAAMAGASLTKQLLAFSRKQVLEPKVVDLNQVIRGMDNMLRRLIGEDIILALHFDENLGYVQVDPSQFEQVIMNLVVNARDAMPAGGKLIIHTRNVVLDHDFADAHLGSIPGEYVMVLVNDNGCGMDSETMSHIFEPFYTTKEKGQGTGLGLPTVYGIIKQSGGYVEVDSQPEAGTTFKIYFPRTDLSINDDALSSGEWQRRTMRDTILLVDDNESIVAAIGAFLDQQGFQVMRAHSASEALALSQQKAPDLLITDVIMPNVNGREIAEAIREKNPKVKVLFMSGYSDEAVVNQELLQHNSAFLQKPVSMKKLLNKIQTLLN